MLGRASSAERSSLTGQGERLSVRRRQRRRRGLIIFVILIILLLVALIWCLWQSSVRISRIQIYGADDSFSTYATQAMQGSYLGIIPRDSVFFFPADCIRDTILAAHPEIAAVSIFRNGLTGLSIKLDNRAPVARWCGDETRFNLENSDLRLNLVSSDCYLFDAKGYLFAAAATTTQTINPFSVYAPLAGDTSEPLRATIANNEKLPSAFDFARQLTTLGASVTRIVIRSDEVDDYLASGTRITYVFGDEQNAFTALVSGRDSLNLADGSLEYIDLRFDGKMYVKKKNGTVSE